MLILAWDLQELSALNLAGREVQVVCEVLVKFCAACFTISTNASHPPSGSDDQH